MPLNSVCKYWTRVKSGLVSTNFIYSKPLTKSQLKLIIAVKLSHIFNLENILTDFGGMSSHYAGKTEYRAHIHSF